MMEGKQKKIRQVTVIDTITQRGSRSKYGRDGMDANHIKSRSQVPPSLDALKGAGIKLPLLPKNPLGNKTAF